MLEAMKRSLSTRKALLFAKENDESSDFEVIMTPGSRPLDVNCTVRLKK